ncbi:response regulator transcription factor [Paenibacillus sp. Soil787]|uniref:response regulator transcription factor n=1 Tax=Paenibacillus sp. Soil787 TaxID=1736411 RepID=UPI000703885A|nr:helix-turn-helix domain-containing protein [Paenibacillus sp. Soil787]KRF19815.1 hypothetical protein ASG93_31845 [Paenibacillus sp. Soil787]
MYKALIIDDEEPARRAIHALGTWQDHRITSIEEAKDGLEGLNLLTAIQPDLIFVDMRMPFIGGVEFLQKAKSISSGKFIVVSGYDDFEFAHGAITSGALDYILKPIKKLELNKAIAKAVSQLDQERAERKSQLSEAILHNISMPLVKEKIFASIIDQNGKFHKIKELEQLIEAKPNDQFQVIIMTISNLSIVSQQKFRGDTHAAHYAITNALNELLSTAGRPFSFKNSREEQEFIIVLTPSDAATHTINSSVEEAALRLREAFGIELMASVGERTGRLDQLDSSYQSAKSFLLHANMLDPQAVYTSETMCTVNRISILSKKDVLLHALEMGSAMYAGNIVRDFFEEVKGSGYFSMEMMLQCSTEFNIVAQRLVSEGNALSPQLTSLLERFELLYDKQVMNFDRYTLSMIAFLDEWFAALLQSHKSTEKLDVELIKAYIDHHYFEDISIALFTEKYFISKEHLLRLFKQRYGCGIYEYTLQVRMEKAKELLMDPELKIQTVSEKIGYNDTNYFSKAFKKHFGISPLAFRRHPSGSSN